MRTVFSALGLLALLGHASAQTFTACNPLNRTDCPQCPALGIEYGFNFGNSSDITTWKQTSGQLNFGTNGAEFTVAKIKDSPTSQSDFYIFFGEIDVTMKAAAGQGIVSSIVLESDDLDEIDWELIGGNNTHVQTNYFGKGNTTAYDRAVWHPISDPFNTFHVYGVKWTKDTIEWFIDGKSVRVLPYAAANGGHNFPQTPMNVRIGIWAGGDPDNTKGVIEWAGGLTDFKKGPYTQYVKNVHVKDYSTGSSYEYGDTSGTWQSIKIHAGNSTAAEKIFAVPAPSLSQKFNALPQSTKLGIYGAAGGLGVALLALIIFCCIKQRRLGRREHEAAVLKANNEHMDNMGYQMDNRGLYSQGNDTAHFETSSTYERSYAAQTSGPVGGYGNSWYGQNGHSQPHSQYGRF